MSSSQIAAILVIGNEILTGRQTDKNVHYIARGLFEYGVDLVEVRIVPDQADAIIGALRTLSAQVDCVFTTGGIGPTHDDITASCVAQAFQKNYGLHLEADQILTQYYQKRNLDYSQTRQRMAYMPIDAALIDNPVSGAPGFQCENVFVLPGVPKIMQKMFDGLLNSRRIVRGLQWQMRGVTILQPESEIANILGSLETGFDGLQVGSYPRENDSGQYFVNVVLRHKSLEGLNQAYDFLSEKLKKNEISFHDEKPSL